MGETYLLGSVDGVWVQNGCVYLADKRLGQVVELDLATGGVELICEKGEGPGDVIQPMDITSHKNQGLAVLSRRLGRIDTLDLSRTPMSRYPLNEVCDGDEVRVDSALAIGETKRGWIGSALRFSRKDDVFVRDNVLFEYEIDQHCYRSIRTVNSWVRVRDYYNEIEHYSVTNKVLATDSDRHVFVAPSRERYYIEKVDLDGVVVDSYSVSVDTRQKKDNKTLRKLEKRLAGIREGRPHYVADFSDYEPYIETLSYVSGDLWVNVNVEVDAPDVEHRLVFDVLSPDLEFQHRLIVAGLASMQDTRVFGMDDAVYLVAVCSSDVEDDAFRVAVACVEIDMGTQTIPRSE